MVHDICVTNRRKVLIFVDWPANQWVIELFLDLLGFNTIAIRARHDPGERDETVAQFNDKNCPVQCLVTSLRISATALNLQKDCLDVIFIDPPSNAQTALQAGGRVCRIG